MRIAFNPSTVAALTTPPNNKDITFDLRGRNIFARGVEFKGTDTWRPVVDNLTSDSTTSSLSAKQGKTLKALIDGKSNSGHTHAWNSLTHSSTTANQAILTNGSANGWKLYTLNISAWDNAANKAHSHSNKSVLDGITSALVNSWNTAYNFVNNITKADTDKIINKWDEIVNFLAGIDSSNKLNTLLNSKLSVYELADKTNVGAIKNSGIYYSTTDASSSTLTNSPFNNGFTLINMTSYDGGDDLRRSRLAFNAYGEIKVSDDRSQSNTTETWYNILTSKNSGISGSTIKLNGSSITVYSSDTADDRYLKLTGGTMRGNIILSSGTRITKTLVSTSNYAAAIDWSVAEETKQYGREIGLHNTGGNDSTGSIAIVPYKTSVEPWSGTVGLFIAKNTLKLDGKNVAFKNDIPSSLKNPYSLTLQANGTTLATYDGSASKIVNFTYANVGAAAKSHTHTSLEPWASYITGDSHAATLKSVFNNNKTSIPRNKFISMLSSAYGNGSYYMGYFLYGYENNPYGGFFVAHYDAAYYIGISNGSFSQHRLVYSTDIPSSLKNPHALTISLNGTSQGPYDGSAAKNINITPGSIGAATSGHNHDDRYLKLTGGTMQLGEGLKFHADENYFGTYSDARIISLLDNNDKVCDGGLIIDERGTLDGKEYVTELLRIRDSEFKWKGSNILHSSNSYVTSGKGVINGTEITQVNNANKWTTARSFTIGNTSKSVDGSSNVSWSLSEIGAASSSHNHDGRYAISENYGGFKKSGRLPISGFYQSYESESGGNAPWKGWVHLINCQHSNPENNYALQIAANFNDNNVFKIRVTDNNVNNTWRNIIHSGNIDSQIVKGAYMTPLTLSVTMLISSGYLASDYTSRYDTQEYMKAAAKYLQKNYSGQSIFGTMAPNSQGFFTANIYSSGFNSNGYPEHITIHYYPHGGTIVNCGTAYGSWYYSSINRDGSSYKLQTARKLWGQSFDGTADVSGTLSGVANIQFSANNAYDIGSNGNASRYIYTHWLGSRSGQKLELGANNSGYGQGLCIDTNLNVGIGTNTPGEKLDVRGKGSFTSGIYSSATISVCSNIEGAEPNQAAIEIRERSRGTTDIAHNYKNAPRIGFHWGNRYWGNLALYNSEFNFLNDNCSGYFNVIANGFKKSSSSDSYVLLGGGGHKAESSLNVANADTTDGVHINWAGTNDNPTYLASWDDSGKAIRAATRANVSVGNADKLDGIHASSGNNKPWGTIPAITPNGWMDIGGQLEFHYDNSTGSDYSTILRCTGNYSNVVDLPSGSGTLALTKDVLTFTIDTADYLNASFNNPEFSKRAASKYIECWDGAGGWWNWMAGKYMVAGGSSSQFLKADGSLDSNSYITSRGGSSYVCSNALSTPANNTVKAYKDSLVEFFKKYPDGIGANTRVSASIISNWSNDTATYYDSSSYSVIKISGAYNGVIYGQYLLSSYNLSKVGIVGRDKNKWSRIKWLAYEDQIPTNNNQLANGAGYITSAGSCAYATSAGNADKARALKYTGTGDSEITAYQTDGSYMGRSGWASYIICNHGNGSTYYSQTIAMPFWSSPIYRRLEGGTDRGWKKFYTEEAPPSWDNVTNKPSTFTPASHTHTWTSITDKMVAGNEFNIVNAGFKGGMWFNYLPINNRDSTATIQGYHFGNGAKGYTSVIASSFVKNGGDENQLLRADGGVATFTWSGQSGQPTWLWGGNSQHSYYVYNPSNFSVKYAASAGAVAWGNVTGRPSSLKNPYSLNIFGVAYDGSAAKTVTTSTFISQVSEATATITDGTMLITSYASNNGFADTNAVNVPYKRKASHLWDYIKAKTDTLYSSKSHTHSYLPLAGGTMNGNARIGHGSGNLYIGNSGNDGWIYTQDIASQLGTDKWNIKTSGAACFGIIHIASKTDGTFNSNIIECNSTIHLNYFSAQDVSLCYGGGKVGIGKSDPLYTLDVAGNGRFQDFVYCNAVYSTTLNHTSSTGHLVIGNKTKEISIRSSNLPDLNALYLYQKFSTNVYYSANKGFGIRPYYLSNAFSNMLPTETVYNNKYSVLTIADKVQAISCIIADKTSLMSGIKGTLIRFMPGDDGQIVLLKDLNNYGVGSNGYFWVQPKGCSIVRSNNSDVYIADGNISSSYDDGGSRFFIYAKTHKVWIEFFCG